jgi:methylenetetrahydrofolate reductase (NADPH)
MCDPTLRGRGMAPAPVVESISAERLYVNAESAAVAYFRRYSTEVSPLDDQSIASAADILPPGSEVFINAPSVEASQRQLYVAGYLRRAGLIPVPHFVARDLEGIQGLQDAIARMTGDAGVDRVLLLAGDRLKPKGEMHCSLQVIESGMLNRYGIRKVWISAYPERHPRIPPAEVSAARREKIIAAARLGMTVSLLTQFCFDASPIVELVRELQSSGIRCPVRLGLAGPAKRELLSRHARACGIGLSADRLLSGGPLNESVFPGDLLKEVLRGLFREPSHAIDGVHLFSFESIAATVQWTRSYCRNEAAA